MSERRKYTAQFKADAVELVISSGRPIAQCAVDLGINEGILGNWVRDWRVEHPEHGEGDPGPVEWAKYRVLQSENAELKRENEFLGYPEVRIMPMFALRCWSGVILAWKAA